jgi:hypothetical protein
VGGGGEGGGANFWDVLTEGGMGGCGWGGWSQFLGCVD